MQYRKGLWPLRQYTHVDANKCKIRRISTNPSLPAWISLNYLFSTLRDNRISIRSRKLNHVLRSYAINLQATPTKEPFFWRMWWVWLKHTSRLWWTDCVVMRDWMQSRHTNRWVWPPLTLTSLPELNKSQRAQFSERTRNVWADKRLRLRKNTDRAASAM